MLEYLAIIITAIFVNNIVFSQFLGICPFLGVSNKLPNAIGMGIAVTVLSILGELETKSAFIMLGIGLASVSISLLKDK